MKIARMLFKPRWQDKDPAVRAAAVAADADPELIAALPELTRSDADPRVRLAALKRLGDYERWRERSTADADAGVRTKARAAYIGMLCAGGKPVPALQRLVSELETLSPAELETVTVTATDRDLRRAAMSYVARPALLAERAIADPDPQLRLAALERIDDVALLERIAERTRKSDKTVSRHARERIEALRIVSGDSGAIAARARQLCERMEALLRDPDPGAVAAAAAITAEWHGLEAAAKQALGARFEGAAAVVARLGAARSAEPVPASTAQAHAASSADVDPAPGPAPPAQTAAPTPAAIQAGEDVATEIGDAVVSRARFDAAVAAAAEHSRRERERNAGDLREIERLAEIFAAQLESGDLGAANATHAKLAELGGAGGAARGAVERRLARHEARYAELKRWQHWSNQRRRRSLCEDIEALGAAGLHPDAVATKVHDARTEWQRLDAMEGHGGEGAGLARRFFGACQRALKPARAYFEKRDAVRDTHRGGIEALLARAAAPVAGSEDWKTLNALRHELGTALRSVSTLDPRDRHAFARRIKAAIAALAPRLDEHAREIEQAKQKLITQAQALAAKADRSATRTVRDLQQQWTALGAGSRSTDQKQWREFRAACDAVFGSLDADRRQREAQSAEQTTRAQALIEEGEAAAADAGLTGAALVARRRELGAAWRALDVGDRRLEQRFQRLVGDLDQRAAQLARQSKLARYSDAQERFRALRRIERGGADEGWTSAGLDAEFAAALDARRQRAADATGAGGDSATDTARDTLVRLEFLAGVPSPAEDRERRMNYQVSRLSARLRGGATAGPERELTELMTAWFALPPALPDEIEQRFDAAVSAVLATLP